MSHLRALVLLRRNISSLLDARKESQTALARWLQKDKSWINKFLNETREIQLKDLDRIADFFGIATYQLFQPGISPLLERRHGERRAGRERRISHAQREMLELTQKIAPARPQFRREGLQTDKGRSKKSAANPETPVGGARPLPSSAEAIQTQLDTLGTAARAAQVVEDHRQDSAAPTGTSGHGDRPPHRARKAPR